MNAPEPALEQLLASAAQGDEHAWRQLVDRYSGRVFGVLRSNGVDADRAEEITQSVFCTLASKLPGYVEQGHFESWLFRIALNRLRDDARRRKRHARPVGDSGAFDALSDGAPTQASGADPEELGALQGALAKLSPSDREVIDLRHLGGMSFKQMAELLQEPLGTLLARHHRALQKLRGLLGGADGDPS
ncbi:MAG: sigma-70 family RNA polymerase sigma factor [Phycisphaerae bacterium]|nr:sigma-70 family RNA polymerase sigma factor [Phycisphaerae bacterium]